MKSVHSALVIALLVSLAEGHVFEGGLLKCSDSYKQGVKYRDMNDATIYWICRENESHGIRVKCPEKSGFLEDEQKCVPWQKWYWQEPRNV